MVNDQQTAVPTEKKRHAATVRGVVVSDKMHKTCIVETKRTLRHRLYHKKLIRKTRLFVHDEKNEAKVGDLVMAVSTRPLSRHKAHKLVKILEKKAVQ